MAHGGDRRGQRQGQHRAERRGAGQARGPRTGPNGEGHARSQAMINLLQRGKEEMPTIRSQLTNENSLNKLQIAPGVLIDTQVRDVALALILHGEGQDLKAYGFEFQPGFNMAQVAVNYWGYGFKTDDDRISAHKKFEQYEAKKKKQPKK